MPTKKTLRNVDHVCGLRAANLPLGYSGPMNGKTERAYMCGRLGLNPKRCSLSVEALIHMMVSRKDDRTLTNRILKG